VVTVELTRLPARELARRVAARELGAVEVVEAHLEAIARRNPALNAVVTVADGAARAAARSLEARIARGEPAGPLAGVPVGIKDETPTAGIRTTWGSRLFADHVPAADAEVVVRLKRAGAIVIGKTNLPEFAIGADTTNAVFGATRNPWDGALSAGGSTGGGAAALAAGMIALAEGSDFGGSLRVPAAFCGVVGLRTTPGLVPRVPSAMPFHDQNVGGPMARDAEDCALMLDALVGLAPDAPLSRVPPWPSAFDAVRRTEDARGLRIAYCADIAGIGVDPEIEGACRAAAAGLAGEGATVEEVAFDAGGARDAFTTLRALVLLGTHLERLDWLEDLDPNLAGNIRAGLEVAGLDVARAERDRAALWRRFRRLFERFDLLLTPTVPVPPFPVEGGPPAEIAGRRLASYIDWVAPTFVVSLATLPAASVPAGASARGLPIGLQIVGPQFAEPRILACARLVARAHPPGAPPGA